MKFILIGRKGGSKVDKEFFCVLPFVHYHPEQRVLAPPSLSCLKHRKSEEPFWSPKPFPQPSGHFWSKESYALCLSTLNSHKFTLLVVSKKSEVFDGSVTRPYTLNILVKQAFLLWVGVDN